jgi:hypothetical protein
MASAVGGHDPLGIDRAVSDLLGEGNGVCLEPSAGRHCPS